MAAPPPLPSSAPPAWRSKGKASPFTKTGSGDGPSGPALPPPRKPRRTESMPKSHVARMYPKNEQKDNHSDYRKNSTPNTFPPPLPSTPRPTAQVDTSNIKVYRYPHSDEKFTLSELIEKHSMLFPIRVRVVKGFFGERGEDSAIAVDEVYNIHFVKKSKVVTIRDVVNNKYILPINSATKFGLIYSNSQITDERHVFETVDDIINATPLPKVVCAQASYQCSDEKASFNKNDVLIVKDVQKSGRFKRGKNTLRVLSLDTMEEKFLTKDTIGKFTVDPSRTKLYLLELLEYLENTIPCYSRMYIDFEANEHLPDYLTSERVRLEGQFVETSVISSPVYEDEEEDPDDPDANDKIVDIPISLDIEISVIPPGDEGDDDDYEAILYTRTENLINGFDPSQAKAHTDTAEQSQLFSAVRKGYEKEGLDIVVPERVNSVHRKKTGSVKVADNHSYQPLEGEEGYVPDDYEDVGFDEMNPPPRSFNSGLDDDRPPPLPPPLTDDEPRPLLPPPLTEEGTRPCPPLPPDRKSRKSPLPQLPAPYKPPTAPLNGSDHSPNSPLSPPTRTTDSSRRSPAPPPAAKPTPSSKRPPSIAIPPRTGGVAVETKKPHPPPATNPKPLKSELLHNSGSNATYSNEETSLREEVQALRTTCQELQSEMQSLKSEVTTLKEMVGGAKVAQSPGNSPGNHELEQLNVEQVQKLLQALGLSKHCQEFANEEIDGSILALCDEQLLEHELHFTSKLDRIKVLQVISGKKSVQRLLQGSYVKFEFKGH